MAQSPSLREVQPPSADVRSRAGQTVVWELSLKRNVRAELKIYGLLRASDIEVLKRQFSRWLEGSEDAAKNE